MRISRSPDHAEKVARIVDQLRAHDGARPLSLRKKAVSHQVPKAGDLRRSDDKIDIGDLTEILEIDPLHRVCVAESGVTFADLVDATLAYGLVPLVVPELRDITVGGAVAGCSIESMSFAYGGFHDSCLEYEVVTATGDVLTCSRDENALIFQMVHGAFGTLGILSKLTFRLVPARPFVHLVYEHHATLESFQCAIRRRADARDVDFMDGIVHARDHYSLALGTFVDRAPYTSDYSWMKIYYRSTATRAEDYLSTRDYFFRYDRGVTNVRPSSWLGRLALGRVMTSRRWLALGAKLHWALAKTRPDVTLDTFVPFSKAGAFMRWYERELDHFPLWVVPYRRVHDYEWLVDDYWRSLDDDLFLDIAIYGMKQTGDRNAHRMIEEKLRELGGIKTLISHNYYPEAEFWQIFNRPNYDAVKRRMDPDNVFRDLYAKTCVAAMGRTT